MAALLLTAAAAPEALQTVNGNIYLVPEEEVVGENLYVSASVVRVHGTIEGDLVVLATSHLQVTGSVKGDVVGFARTASIEGAVEGSVRLAGVDIKVSAEVGDEVAVLAREAVVGGEVGGDALVWAVRLLTDGGLGRDVGGRTVWATIDGLVGRDVEMTVDHLRVGPSAVIAGDLGYRSADDAEIDPGATIGGTLVRRTPLSPDIWLRAGRLLGGLVFLLLFLAMGLLAIRFRPEWLDTCTERLRSHLTGTVVRGVVALLFLTLPVTVPVLAIWVGSPFGVMVEVIMGVVGLVPALLVL
ncbi:MAG: polymer-forming cytoskeletal protein, partial [Acidimicrobiia bacterium]|nr:polymer-forming cytoskeletal protein [Acidimicrobiia bacterium]